MKGNRLLICCMALLCFSAACKKKSTAAPAKVVNNTNAPANVATSIDSANVATHYEVDVYAGQFTDAAEYGYITDTSQLSFSIRHITSSLAVITCSQQVQVDDIGYRQPAYPSSIYDSVNYVGKGSYTVGTITFKVQGINIGDSLFVSWAYENGNHPSDPGHYCNFAGKRVK